MVSPGLKRTADHLSASATDSKKPKSASITSFFGPPKPKTPNATQATASEPASVLSRSASFNKDKWVASLTAEQKELLQLEIDTLDESWLAYLKDEVVTTEFLNLKRFLKKEKDSKAKIFPPEEDVYSWYAGSESGIIFVCANIPRSRHTPLHSVKVVIIGQDPYHNDNQAHGLAFSVRPPTRAPPSLVNIYKGIKKNYPDFQIPPNNVGLLTPWADRGVLMLNTCLTVRAHQANSHSNKGWERFTQKAIDLVARVRTNGVVFLAWGNPAGLRVAKINRQKHCVLQSVHPSPLSAHRGFVSRYPLPLLDTICILHHMLTRMTQFDNEHFKKCNDWLISRYGDDGFIDWSLVPTKRTAITLPSNKENSSTLANVGSSPTAATRPCPDKDDTKPCPVEDEFEDADALEALMEAEETAV
jgi:uracil-DNA glycosylase